MHVNNGTSVNKAVTPSTSASLLEMASPVDVSSTPGTSLQSTDTTDKTESDRQHCQRTTWRDVAGAPALVSRPTSGSVTNDETPEAASGDLAVDNHHKPSETVRSHRSNSKMTVNCPIKAASKSEVRDYHATNMDVTTVMVTLEGYLKQLAPSVKVEKLTPRFPQRYSSFKVLVLQSEASNILKCEIWPAVVRVNQFSPSKGGRGDKLMSKVSYLPEDAFSLFYFNSQVLGNKTDDLALFLMENDFDFVCITEHRLDEQQIKTLNMNGYNIASFYCGSRNRYGGVALMAKNTIIVMETSPETRTIRERKRPQWMQDYEVSFYSEDELPIPTNIEEVMTSEDKAKWQEAIDKELKVLSENNTWDMVPWPSADTKVIDSKWVFKKKSDDEYKARLVARGFQQESSEELYDIYASVAKLTTFRMLLVLSGRIGKTVHQMDVRSAFLYGDIEEEVFMSLPGNNKTNSEFVCKLNKSIYGLKKSPKCWNKKFNSVMKSEGFSRSENDFCLYSKCLESKELYVLLYVDDVLVLGTDDDQVNSLKKLLNSKFFMKDLGTVSNYLGIEVKQDLKEGIIELSQVNYLRNVLKRFNMHEYKPVKTPLESNPDVRIFVSEENNLVLQKKCRQIIGSLMYAALGCRPDICEPVSLLSQFQDKANENLYRALKRILRYIQGTLDFILTYELKNDCKILCGFVDSDWAGDTIDRKSTTGYVFKFFGYTISWASKKQQTVSISSTESEYVALSLAVTEACWLRKF
nr:unnamed protein product [Callosobruchus analis]